VRAKVWVYLVCVAIVGVVTAGQGAFALTTTETYFSDNSPLVISAYQTFSGGKDIGLIELYNDGDAPVDIGRWSVVDDTNKRTLRFSTQYTGLLEPKQHVVLASPGFIDGNSSYLVDGWQETILSPATITTLSLRSLGYRNSDVSVKSTSALMQRNRGVDGYLSTFTDITYRSLFDDGLYMAPAEPVGLLVDEIYPYASDCAPFDKSILCSDYVKLANTSSAPINLDYLVLRTDSNSSGRTGSNTIQLGGVLLPGEYRTIWLTDDDDRLSLTNSGGYVWLEDKWETTRYETTLAHYESAGVREQGMAYAKSRDLWIWTLSPQPSGPNKITLLIEPTAECPVGKYRNPDTGRCRSVEEAVNELATCPEGQTRNPDTNRCRSATTVRVSQTPCGEGQERNPATNRCRSIASAVAELLPCDEGYERNPATNRCRKALTSEMPLAPFPVQTVTQSGLSNIVWWSMAAVAAGAVGYAVWEWRQELRSLGHRLSRTLTRRK
jgi:hypothetical protein